MWHVIILGAGRHKSKYHKEYKKVCNRACRKGMEVLQRGGSALDAVKEAVIGNVLVNSNMYQIYNM